MSIYHQIITAYPELTITENYDPFANGTIILQDDADGIGPYIREWNYNQPMPEGLTLGKPSA